MQACGNLPRGALLYRQIQKRFGRLVPDPMKRLPTQLEMAQWLSESGFPTERKLFLEVGTGHIPIVPIGFFLSGAEGVLTVDLHRRLDWQLTRKSLRWMGQNRDKLQSMYADLVSPSILSERLSLMARLWTDPHRFFEEAGIKYLAPADTADTSPPSLSTRHT
jgi:hypothetical protein